MKIMPDAHKDIIEAYTISLWSLQEIADVLHVSRTAVHKFLKKQGVDTSKRQLTVSCTVCGISIKRTRKRIRRQKNHFCTLDCYHTFLDAGKTPYIAGTRHSQRLARHAVSKHYNLKDGNIVHHEDRNTFNNDPYNLKVFANQGDHIRYHHIKRDKYCNRITNKKTTHDPLYNDFDITPLWDGKNL